MQTLPHTSFVLGGSDAKAGDYPHHVIVCWNGGAAAGCGGVLIAPDVVLSAAHCIAPTEGCRVNHITLNVGAMEPQMQGDGYRHCDEWIIHPSHIPQVYENGEKQRGTGVMGGNDLFLCRLEAPVEIKDTDPLVVLSNDHDFPLPLQSLTIMRLGATQPDFTGMPTTLQEIAIPAIPDCEQ